MNTLSYKTNSVKAEQVKKEWVVVDATDQVLGRFCAKVAYISYTGYPGGQRYASPAILQQKSLREDLTPGMHPLFLHVLKGMLPKNRLGAQLLTNVHIYNGNVHPHEAQDPKVIDINKLK